MNNFEKKYFFEAIKYLLDENIVKNKSELADFFEIKNSTFSEILNNRSNPSLFMYSILVKKFNINSNWLLTGKGNMLENKEVENERKMDCNKLVEKLEKQLDRQEREIERMQKRIDELENK